jgi:hypothetical protein
MGSVNKWANYGKWRHGKKRNELLNIVTKPEDVPDEIMNPIMEDVARQVENWENAKKADMLKPPPPPPKDRIFKESSWLETITFGLYKSKK